MLVKYSFILIKYKKDLQKKKYEIVLFYLPTYLQKLSSAVSQLQKEKKKFKVKKKSKNLQILKIITDFYLKNFTSLHFCRFLLKLTYIYRSPLILYQRIAQIL